MKLYVGRRGWGDRRDGGDGGGWGELGIRSWGGAGIV